MSFIDIPAILFLLGNILLSSPGRISDTEGYRAVIRYEDGFLAAGSEGRIDLISVSGKISKSEKFPGENFNCLISDDHRVLAGGDNGTILISSEDGVFRKTASGTGRNIYSLAVFNKRIIAGSGRGEIITIDDKGALTSEALPLKGNIVSLSARASDCFGVTDEGEIIKTSDGKSWDIFDFNQVYSGFYKACRFTKVLATENCIAAAGINYDGSPVFMFSNQGKVWTERQLIYTDERGAQSMLDGLPADFFYNAPADQFFLVCTNGKLLKLPSCSHCNELSVVSEQKISGISCNENTMILVGENFYVKYINIR
jgi:hypothetical protein